MPAIACRPTVPVDQTTTRSGFRTSVELVMRVNLEQVLVLRWVRSARGPRSPRLAHRHSGCRSRSSACSGCSGCRRRPPDAPPAAGDQVGLAQQRPPHGDEVEAVAPSPAPWCRSRLIPPSSISGIDSASRNRSAFSLKYASSNGYSLRNRLPPSVACPTAPAAASRRRTRATGVSPRKRYIGFISELPPLSCSASRVPSASSSRAKSSASSPVSPPRNPSSRLTLAVTATSPPTSSRTARATWRASRARFSSDPPQRSLRRLRPGARKLEIR